MYQYYEQHVVCNRYKEITIAHCQCFFKQIYDDDDGALNIKQQKRNTDYHVLHTV